MAEQRFDCCGGHFCKSNCKPAIHTAGCPCLHDRNYEDTSEWKRIKELEAEVERLLAVNAEYKRQAIQFANDLDQALKGGETTS